MKKSPRRSALFVGALALEDLSVALGSGADMVCVDLEDAVPPGYKDEGRAALFAALRDLAVPAEVQLTVRINSLRSLAGIADIRSCLLDRNPIGALLLPKVETDDEVRWAGALADEAGSNLELHAIIETPDGLENCRAIARAHPRITALCFGGFDLSTALGSAMAWEPLLYARSRVVHAAAGAGIDALDSPFPNIGDQDGLRIAAEQAKALGMVGKTAKHATQIATIQDVFTPKPQEVQRAREIQRLFEADPTRPLVYEGKLVELPTIKRLRHIASFDVPGI